MNLRNYNPLKLTKIVSSLGTIIGRIVSMPNRFRLSASEGDRLFWEINYLVDLYYYMRGNK